MKYDNLRCPFCRAEIRDIKEYEELFDCSCGAKYIVEFTDDLYMIQGMLADEFGWDVDVGSDAGNLEMDIFKGYDTLLEDPEASLETGLQYDLVFVKLKIG